jgi:TP901 family phage tail tape measure protein
VITVGGVRVPLGADFQPAGFRQFDQAVARAQHHKRVEVRMGAAYSGGAVRSFEREVGRASTLARRPIRARLVGSFDPRPWRQHEAAVAGAERRTSLLGRTTGALGRTMRTTASYIGLYGVAGAIGLAGKATIDFDRGMRNVNSLAQLSEGRFQALSQRVLGLAGKTAQAPKTLASGLYDLVSSGFKADDAMKVLRASAFAATAGLTDTATSTKAVAAVINAYRLSASDASSVSDVLFQTVNRGVITFEQLANNIGTVLPFASALGVDLSQVGAAISTMTKQGFSGELAITDLKNALVAFNKPTTAMSAALKTLGFDSGQALIKSKGFEGALQALMGTTDGTQASIAKLFPNIRASAAALALTGKNSKMANADLAAFKNTHGATAKALSQQSQSISYAWNRIKAAAAALVIEVGSKAAPAIAKFMNGMVSGKGAGGDFVKTVKSIGSAILAVLVPIAKFVAGIVKFVAQTPGLKQVAGGLIAVGLALKTIQFAGKLSGISNLISLLGRLKTKFGEAAAAEGAMAAAPIPTSNLATPTSTSTAKATSTVASDAGVAAAGTAAGGKWARAFGAAGEIGLVAAGAVMMLKLGDALKKVKVPDLAQPFKDILVKGLRGPLGTIVDFFKDPMKALKSFLIGAAKEAFLGPFALAGRLVNAVVKKIFGVDLIGAVGHGIADAGKAIAKLPGIFLHAVSTLPGLFAKIPGALLHALSSLPGLAMRAASGLVNGFIRVLPRVANFAGKVLGFFLTLPLRLGALAVKAGLKLATGIAHAAPAIARFAGKAVGYFITLPLRIGALGVKAATKLIQALLKVVPKIPGLVAKVVSGFAHLVSKLPSIGLKAGAGLVRGLTSLLKKIPGLVGKVVSAFLHMAGRLFKAGVNAANELRKGLGHLLSEIPHFLSQIVSGFFSLAGRLFHAGVNAAKAFVSGLVNTVKNAPGIKQIRGLANAIFGNSGGAVLHLSQAQTQAHANTPLSGRQTGGPVAPGHPAGQGDRHLAVLAAQEHIITEEEVQAAGGHDAIYKMRSHLRKARRLPKFVQTTGAPGTAIQEFASLGNPMKEVGRQSGITAKELDKLRNSAKDDRIRALAARAYALREQLKALSKYSSDYRLVADELRKTEERLTSKLDDQRVSGKKAEGQVKGWISTMREAAKAAGSGAGLRGKLQDLSTEVHKVPKMSNDLENSAHDAGHEMDDAAGSARSLQSAVDRIHGKSFSIVEYFTIVETHVKRARGGRGPSVRGGKINHPGVVPFGSALIEHGEEAPLYPEFWISTNPRDKQRMIPLLREAAASIGASVDSFATGGKKLGRSILAGLGMAPGGSVASRAGIHFPATGDLAMGEPSQTQATLTDRENRQTRYENLYGQSERALEMVKRPILMVDAKGSAIIDPSTGKQKVDEVEYLRQRQGIESLIAFKRDQMLGYDYRRYGPGPNQDLPFLRGGRGAGSFYHPYTGLLQPLGGIGTIKYAESNTPESLLGDTAWSYVQSAEKIPGAKWSFEKYDGWLRQRINALKKQESRAKHAGYSDRADAYKSKRNEIEDMAVTLRENALVYQTHQYDYAYDIADLWRALNALTNARNNPPTPDAGTVAGPDLGGNLAQLQAFMQARSDLFSQFGSNFTPSQAIGAPSVLPSNFDTAAAVGAAAAGGGYAAPGSGRPNIDLEIINNFNGGPGSAHGWAQAMAFQTPLAFGGG